MRRYGDLLAVAGLASTSVAIVLSVSDLPTLRLPFAALLLLILPGYSLQAVLFPLGAISWSRIIMLSVGTSIALDVLIAIGLNLSPWRLRAGSWAVGLLAFEAAACALAAIRRSRDASHEPRAAGARLRVVWLDIGLLLMAACLVGFALGLGRTPLSAKNAVGYTTLWLLPGLAKEPSDLRFGVESRQLGPRVYRLVLRRGNDVLYSKRIPVLRPGQQYHSSLRVPPAVARGRLPVEALLYDLARPRSVYRFVKLWPRGER